MFKLNNVNFVITEKNYSSHEKTTSAAVQVIVSS